MVDVANIPTYMLKKCVPYSQVQTFPVAHNIRMIHSLSHPVCFHKVNEHEKINLVYYHCLKAS